MLFNDTQIILDEKRKISISSLYQWQTYKNLLCGLPTSEMNEGIIEDAVNYAKKTLIEAKKIFLIKPIETPIEVNEKLSYGAPFKLPPITCIAEISYWELLNYKTISSISDLNIHNMIEVDYKCSDLGIVWYQENFSMPVDKNILEEFRNTDWSI